MGGGGGGSKKCTCGRFDSIVGGAYIEFEKAECHEENRIKEDILPYALFSFKYGRPENMFVFVYAAEPGTYVWDYGEHTSASGKG